MIVPLSNGDSCLCTSSGRREGPILFCFERGIHLFLFEMLNSELCTDKIRAACVSAKSTCFDGDQQESYLSPWSAQKHLSRCTQTADSVYVKQHCIVRL